MGSRVGVVVLIILLVAALAGDYLLYQQVGAAQVERDTARRQAEQARVQVDRLDSQVAELQGLLDTVGAERDTLQAERDQVQQRLQALQQADDGGASQVAEGDVAQVQQNLQATLGNLNASATDLREALQVALDAIQGLGAALATRAASGDAQALQARIDELQAEVDRLQRSVRRDVNASRLAQLEQERDAARAQVDQLTSQLQGLEQQLTDLEADLGEQQDEVERLQAALSEAQGRIDAATAARDQAIAEAGRLQAELDSFANVTLGFSISRQLSVRLPPGQETIELRDLLPGRHLFPEILVPEVTENTAQALYFLVTSSDFSPETAVEVAVNEAAFARLNAQLLEQSPLLRTAVALATSYQPVIVGQRVQLYTLGEPVGVAGLKIPLNIRLRVAPTETVGTKRLGVLLFVPSQRGG